MTTFYTNLSELDGSRLQALLDSGLREGRQLDFKEVLPGANDEEHREFLSDVSSFANAAGGDLIYGIRERRDGDGRTTGEGEIVGLLGLNFDEQRRRLEDMIRTGIEPRLPAQLKEITRGADLPCLLIRIPKRWSGLHMVTFKRLNRFYGRNSGGKYLLDVREIERGFLAGTTARERARAFRHERIAGIVGGDTPVPLSGDVKLILHAVPLDTDDQAWTRFRGGGGEAVATAMKEALVAPLYGYSSFGSGNTFNLDGFLAYTSVSTSRYAAYTQLFRAGALEVVLLVDAHHSPQTIKQPRFSGSAVEHYAIAAVSEVQKIWRHLGLTGPMMVGLALTGLGGSGIVLDKDVRGLPGTLPQRDPLVLPEVVVDDLEAAPEAMLRALFDLLWNAGGVAGSPNYQGGTWKRH